MFRDEGTEPSIEFKNRMRERVERTPTSLLIVSLPVLAIARAFLVAWSYYTKTRRLAVAERIESARDLRSKLMCQVANRN